jgi:hypothetical protein
MKNVYHGSFSCWEDVVNEFTGATYNGDAQKEVRKAGLYKEPKVLYANYDTQPYEGSACVIWKKGKKYYLLYGSHCSCYGLENTGWDPEEFANGKIFLDFLNKTRYIDGLEDKEKQEIIKRIR